LFETEIDEKVLQQGKHPAAYVIALMHYLMSIDDTFERPAKWYRCHRVAILHEINFMKLRRRSDGSGAVPQHGCAGPGIGRRDVLERLDAPGARLPRQHGKDQREGMTSSMGAIISHRDHVLDP
jgi:hypothetical protein